MSATLKARLKAVARTHRDPIANDSREVLRGRGDRVATCASRDANRGVGVHEVEEELLVRYEVEPVYFSRRKTEIGNELRDGGLRGCR